MIPIYNPWAVVDTVRRELAREGVKTSFSIWDRMGELDEFHAASALLRALGVEPVAPAFNDTARSRGEL